MTTIMLFVWVWAVILRYHFVFNTDFHIESSGVFPVEVDDLGIRFYLTIANNGNERITVQKAHKPECCWEVEPDDEDCESMELYGGFPADIDTKTKKNVTYVFPNLYPLDRKGVCKFHFKQVGLHAIMHQINFDTHIQDDDSWMKKLFGTGPVIYKQCNGIDENPRNNCHPYLCAKKYNGYRSFYNTEQSKCIPVKQCTTRVGDDNLPTSAFDFEGNRCKSLVEKVLANDEKKVVSDILDDSPLVKEFNKYVDVNPEDLIINCKNGVQNGRFCRCNKGWRTVSVSTAGGGMKMNWCSKKVPIKSIPSKPSKYIKIALLVVLLAICCSLLLLVLYLWWRLFFREVLQRMPKVDNNTKTRLKLKDFPFQLDTKWKLGGVQYDSNTAQNKDVFSGEEIYNDLSEEEIFLNHADYISGKEDRNSTPTSELFNYDDYAQIDGRDVNVIRNPSTIRPPQSLNEHCLHVTDSDSFVLVPQSGSDSMTESVRKRSVQD